MPGIGRRTAEAVLAALSPGRPVPATVADAVRESEPVPGALPTDPVAEPEPTAVPAPGVTRTDARETPGVGATPTGT